MKILLAGGAGYIGSLLAKEILEKGYKIDVIDLFWFGNHLPQGVGVIKNDLFHCTERDIEGYDQVIFLAGLSNDPMAELNLSKNFIFNAALPAYLAYLSKKVGVRRFIYASSCSVYGNTHGDECNENIPANSDYPYGISKLQGEQGIHQLQDKNFSVISLRQGTVSGHSPRMRMDLFVNTMFKTAIDEGRIIVNNPSVWRPFYDIVDSMQAFISAIRVDYNVSGVFNVATKNYQVIEAAYIVKKKFLELIEKDIFIDIKNIQDFRDYRVSIQKAVSVLGFHPIGSIERVVDELSRQWRMYGDCNNEKYYNIKVFSKLI